MWGVRRYAVRLPVHGLVSLSGEGVAKALPLAWVALLSVAPAAAQAPAADSLFASGRLQLAAEAYSRQLAENPSDAAAEIRLGLLALWANRLEAAESLLHPHAAADRNDSTAVAALAEVLYRRRRFLDAAPLYRRLGREAMASKAASLAEPYVVSLPREATRLPFASGAILPVLRVRVNGMEANFLLDTGAGETILDTEFAKAVGARSFGTELGTYAGGRTASYEHGTVKSVQVGDAHLTGVPVHIQSTAAYRGAAGGREVSGILGTGVLAQFRSTIDYGAQELILEPRESPAAHGSSVPFWLLGDHFVTVSATVAGSVETLLVIDTGLAIPGGAFVPASSVLEEAGVEVRGTSGVGVGGGGTVTVTPFRIDRVSVGPLLGENLLSVAGAFPPALEKRFTARIGGLLSHGFFQGQRITLDFDGMRLWIAPSQRR